jgi:hypothetical protein
MKAGNRLPLLLLGRGDLLLDVDRRPAQNLATQARHRGVDDLGALLGDLSEDRGPRRLDLLRDLAETRSKYQRAALKVQCSVHLARAQAL